jgi:hypothetical protein
MTKEALSHLVLKDLNKAAYEDAIFGFFYDYRYKSVYIRADWFLKPTIVIRWRNDVEFTPNELTWESALVKDRLFDDPLSQATQWIKTCVNEHKKCNLDYEANLPRRVIHIDVDGSKLRLDEGLHKKARYAALSHCWGKSKDLVSNSQNIAQHKLDIPLVSLPKTFRDAVTFCQQLEIEYLWIDSLCIIQDDRADWEQEAEKMGSIYENAFLTLAASAAADDNGGFWFNTPSLEWKGVTSRGGFGNAIAHSFINHGARNSPYFPLSSRGWVFQERILSRRTLQFGRQELLWECKEMKLCECTQRRDMLEGNKTRPRKYAGVNFGTGKPDFGTDYDIWSKLVEEYSVLNLSVPSDRLPAISAIAKKVAIHRKSRYLAGLWEDELPINLLWVVSWGLARKRPEKWRASSWSWVSIDSGVYFLPLGDTHQEHHSECRILSADCQTSGINEYGEVASGCLRVEGKVVKMKFKELPPSGQRVAEDIFFLDYIVEIEPEEDVFCMRVARYRQKLYCNYSLALRCVNPEKREFERFGLLYRCVIDGDQTAYCRWWGPDEGDRKPEVAEIMFV